MKRPYRCSVLLLSTVIIALIMSPIPAVFGIGNVPASDGTWAGQRSWPAGVELLAAAELNLPPGSYDWHITTQALTTADVAFSPGNGVLVTANGNVLAQIDNRETVRLGQNAASVTVTGEQWHVRSADAEKATLLIVELLPKGTTGSHDDAMEIGPLDVPGGNTTLALVNIAGDEASTDTQDKVMEGALHPGVSIRHDESGIPAKPDPRQSYDHWAVALFPHGETRSTPTRPSSTPVPAGSPAVPATPTAEATATWTPTTEVTYTPTLEPTFVPTDVPAPPPAPTYPPTPTEPWGIPPIERPTFVPPIEIPTFVPPTFNPPDVIPTFVPPIDMPTFVPPVNMPPIDIPPAGGSIETIDG